MRAIYDTIPKLKDEYQDVLLKNYKLTELHYLLNNYDEFQRYLQEVLDTANRNILAMHALIGLYKESVKENGNRKCVLIEGIGKMYDALPEESKQKVCEDLLGRRKFFEDAYRLIMDTFKDAAGEKEDAVQE